MSYWNDGIANLIASGVTVKEIADKTGLAISTVYDLKNGHSSEPRGMAAVELNRMFEAEKVGAGGTARKLKEAA